MRYFLGHDLGQYFGSLPIWFGGKEIGHFLTELLLLAVTIVLIVIIGIWNDRR